MTNDENGKEENDAIMGQRENILMVLILIFRWNWVVFHRVKTVISTFRFFTEFNKIH